MLLNLLRANIRILFKLAKYLQAFLKRKYAYIFNSGVSEYSEAIHTSNII